MMNIQVAEPVVRSERPSLESLKQSLAAIKRSSTPEELAQLMMLAVELYADGECRCEEKAAVFGDDSEQASACNIAIKVTHGEMLDAFRGLAQKVLA